MKNDLDDLFGNHFENHLNELKTILISQIRYLGIRANDKQTEIPEELLKVQKELHTICNSFYQEIKENIINQTAPKHELKATEKNSSSTSQMTNPLNDNAKPNNSSQILEFKERIATFNKKLKYISTHYPEPRLQQVINKISKAISLETNNSWASKTSQTIELYANVREVSDGTSQEKYDEVFHSLKNNYPPATHDNLIKCGQLLGYSLHDEGICMGVTMRWIEAIILRQQPRFLNRIYKIMTLIRLLNQGKTVEELQKKPEWKDVLWDIKAFYESLYLYQYAGKMDDFFGKHVHQNDLGVILEFASSNEIREIGGIKRTRILRYDEFTADSILTTLGNLEEKIKESGYQSPVCFLLHCCEEIEAHAINATYDPSHHSWQWMDINLPIQQSGKLNDFWFMQEKRYFEQFDIFCISAILPNENSKTLEQALSTIEKINYNHRDRKINQSILFEASQSGDLEITKEILTLEGINPNQTWIDGETPLYMAAQNGFHEIVNTLLAHKEIDPNKATNDDETPLYISLFNGFPEVAKALLAHDDINFNQASKDGTNPLLIAAKKGYAEIVKALLDKGANPNQANNNALTPLFIAAQKGHLEILKALLDKGANPNQANNNGLTPLFIAAFNGFHEIVNALLANEEIDPNKALIDGLTPLFIAAQKGHLEILKALLDKGANPNQANNKGITPLFIATLNGFHEIVNALLANEEIDPNKPMIDGRTLLFIAAEKGHLEVLKVLLNKGANPNQGLNNGLTALFIAAQNNNLEIIEYLLEHEKLEITKPLKNTQEALQKFARNKTSLDNNVIEKMNNHIAEYKLKFPGTTMIEITPEEIAFIMGHTDIQNLLKQFSCPNHVSLESRTFGR